MSRRFEAADVVAIAVVIVWGSSYPVVKSVYNEVNPLAFTLLRFIIASAVVAPVAVMARPWKRFSRSDWVRTLIVGVLTVTVYQICFSVGLAYTTASNSALIVSSAPVFTLLYVLVTRSEHVHWTTCAGIGIALVGLYMVVVPDGLELSAQHLIGNAITLGSPIAYGFSSAIARPVTMRQSASVMMGIAIPVGTIALLPFTLGQFLVQDWSVSVGTWVKLGYSSVVAAAFSYVAWFWCVRRIGATKTSAYGYFIPISAVALSVAFLQESLTVTTIIGAMIVFSGVALTRSGKQICRSVDTAG